MFSVHQKRKKKKGPTKDDYVTKIDKQKEHGHLNVKSKQCPKYKETLTEMLQKDFGGSMEKFTRKLYLESVLRPSHKALFTDKVIKLSEFIKNVTFHRMITWYSDSLSAARVTLGTTYLNHIVEIFKDRLGMPKGFLYMMAEKYCYERLLGSNGNPKWPKQFDLVRIAHVYQITGIIQKFKNWLLISPNTTNITASPTKFISVLGYIISELESFCSNCTDPLDKPRSLSLAPTPSLRWKYISINCISLATIVKKKSGTIYRENIEQFYPTFDSKKFRFESKVAEEKFIQNSDVIPLIIFAEGMKNNDMVVIKDHAFGATRVLQRELQLRSITFGSVVVDINEFRTSNASIVTVFKY
ncbi:uncharacterized protein BX663DRAFT_556018 [Cokeromyces recurvatus]|uniref:uncharacterized protein n=1 Tax=Cokeromyces recurvatus TaxID=90255 RepID=UPI00221F4031|nr:uncharacterized protein BX663DRAFT_556018 [Cokeromyces recurvatus]KAI7898206.1 hypothetical protein BX663DRAFT_556018 [Cokeromyces recurvatus]